MDTVQKHIYSNYHSPSSEPYRVYNDCSLNTQLIDHTGHRRESEEILKYKNILQKAKYEYFTTYHQFTAF
jgi:hypothetical protein